MRVGFNYPWSRQRYGGDFGPNIHVDHETWLRDSILEQRGNLTAIKLPPLFEHVDRNLANLKKMGVSVVRWFVLGNGNAYGPAPRRRLSVELPTDSAGTQPEYDFSPPTSIDSRFRRDFEELLKRFQRADTNKEIPGRMQLIPSLIDFGFGSDVICGSGPAPGTGYGGRSAVITDRAKRKIFLDSMLGELLAACRPWEEQIYAWEVINEPIWLCSEYGPLSSPEFAPRKPEVSFAQMKSFLDDAITRIEKAGYRSTVGHRYHGDFGRFPTGTMPQFHYYGDSAWLTRIGMGASDASTIHNSKLFSMSPKPFLGEFDSHLNRSGNAWQHDPPLPDTTLRRLQLLEKEGCELAIIWPDFAGAKKGRVDGRTLEAEKAELMARDKLKLQHETRKELVAYTGGTLPPASE